VQAGGCERDENEVGPVCGVADRSRGSRGRAADRIGHVSSGFSRTLGVGDSAHRSRHHCSCECQVANVATTQHRARRPGPHSKYLSAGKWYQTNANVAAQKKAVSTAAIHQRFTGAPGEDQRIEGGVPCIYLIKA